MRIIEKHLVPLNIGKIRLSDYAREIFLKYIPSRNGIKKAIKNKLIQVNGEPASTGLWVEPNQEIILLEDEKPCKIFQYKLTVIFEDDHLAVINKPSGLLVSGNQFRTIENSLEFNLNSSSQPDALVKMRPVHRLDRLTSGLLIIAKTRSCQKNLDKMFKEHQIEKRYQAIVMGKMPPKGIINKKIENKPALTKFQVVKIVPSLKSGWLSLVDLWLESGRTHQLRIHLAQAGFPILGDTLYAEPAKTLKGSGLFLVAVQLQLPHPINKNPMNFTILPPNKFKLQLAREEQRYYKFNPE
jgi:RluA family pseudouridine synthase